MIIIYLSKAEMFNACTVGVQRRLRSIADHVKNKKHAEDKKDFDIDIYGAVAEAALAKHIDRYWACGVNTFKAPDVGRWQVRSTTYPTGHLIVRERDEPPGRVALLTTPPELFGAMLHGWIDIEQARQDRYWQGDSWWVPQEDLNPFIEGERYD